MIKSHVLEKRPPIYTCLLLIWRNLFQLSEVFLCGWSFSLSFIDWSAILLLFQPHFQTTVKVGQHLIQNFWTCLWIILEILLYSRLSFSPSSIYCSSYFSQNKEFKVSKHTFRIIFNTIYLYSMILLDRTFTKTKHLTGD